MKRIWKRNLLSALLILAVMLLPALVMGQFGDPGDGTDPGCEPLDPTCPIDGGLSALLALGAGYGIKKVRDARKSISKNI